MKRRNPYKLKIHNTGSAKGMGGMKTRVDNARRKYTPRKGDKVSSCCGTRIVKLRPGWIICDKCGNGSDIDILGIKDCWI